GIGAACALGCGDAPGAADLLGGPGGGGVGAHGGAAGGGSGGAASSSSTSSSSTSSGQGGGGAAGGSTGPLTVAECYADDFLGQTMDGPDYDQFGPTVGSHCMGTNHQTITQVERVVFLGDSVTVGTPPTPAAHSFRAQLADQLATHFSIPPAGPLWKMVDLFNGKALFKESGAFASCAKWGARTDDLTPTQLPDCFPQSSLDKRTLVIITMGGNDISNLTQNAIEGATEPELWQQAADFVQLQRDAVEWLLEPGRFPNGVFVVFGNMFEFTDGTGEVEACDVSALAGFDQPVPSPEQLAAMVIWANEQFVKLAVDTGTDVIFMLEDFCGHGFNADNPAAPCYRGPGVETWFDLTCIHPNPTGHDHITDMFMAVVNE
ncbi:MAG: hypothetical protein JRI68_25915, partial [Deltaproteobacteria bacterium]|nr:hypothetical protein [Deltaproteobacteria bacterium]